MWSVLRIAVGLVAAMLAGQRVIQDQDILQYLNQTVTWYRDINAVLRAPMDSQEATLADGLRHSSTEAGRLAFDFARGQAAIPAANGAEKPAAGDARSRTLAQSAAAAAERAEQAQQQIDDINRRLQSASGRSRAQLLALRDEVTSEANFAKARRDALRTLTGFLNTPAEGGLAAKIAELERSVPELANQRPKAATDATPNSRAAAPQDFHPESSGIVGLGTEVFSVARKISRLDRLVDETDALRKANESIRLPLRTALRQVIRRGDAVTQAPDSTDIDTLSAQRKEVESLLAQFKQLSAASVPLSEESVQIAASRGRMLEWRSVLAQRYAAALRYLLLRLAMLCAALLTIFGLSELWRRTTIRYVQDMRRRRQILLFRRIVVGFAVALFVVLSFVTEFGSLATIAGFSAAGVAVAMQSVLLSMVAYFFLVGRWGVRVGDRVTVSGVTGEVADVGLFRLYLMELSGPELALQPTGRVVVFPNAVFFQPAAVFKQLPGFDYVWRSITLKLAGTADYSVTEKQLLGLVESIYAEYRDRVERDHKNLQNSLNLHTAVPRPESRVRLVDSGVEMTIRYPVEVCRAADIEDRITREIIHQVEGHPAVAVVSSQP